MSAFITEEIAEQRAQFILVNATKLLPRGLIHELLPATEMPLPPALHRKRLPAVLLEHLNYDADSPLRERIRTPPIMAPAPQPSSTPTGPPSTPISDPLECRRGRTLSARSGMRSPPFGERSTIAEDSSSMRPLALHSFSTLSFRSRPHSPDRRCQSDAIEPAPLPLA